MEDIWKITIVVLILVGFAVGAYFTYANLSYQNELQKKTLYCKMLTEQLNNQSVHSVNSSSPCVSYYCRPNFDNPAQFNGMAQPMCACQCKTVNGTTLNIWVGSSQ